MIRISLLLAFVCVLPAHGAEGIVLFQGPPAGPGDVVIVDPTGLAAPVHPVGLQGIRLLDLEVNGRSHLERFLPGRAWLEQDVPGAARVVLPSTRGSVYHFVRPEAAGADAFGYFLVDYRGDARVVLERPGTGPAGDVDPFLSRIGVAPDGRALLAATTPAGGGDLLEVDLQAGVVLDRTQTLPPQTIRPNGLALQADWGLGVVASGVLRFDRTAGASASSVDFGAAPPAWFPGDVVFSPSGLHAATIAGAAAPLADVWVFSADNAASRVSQTPSTLSGAGFLPESEHGPFLAVSDDGATCAWRVEGLKREAFLGRAGAPLGQSPQQVTADPYYVDTLDEIGQYIFRPLASIAVLAVGSLGQNAPFELENADFYEVSLDANGAPQFQNLSLTSGSSQTPFPVSALKPNLAAWTPDQGALVFHDDEGERLVAARPGQSGIQLLLPDVKEVQRVDALGADLVAILRRSTGNKDRELHVVPSGNLAPTVSFFSAPDTDSFQRVITRPDGVFGFVQTLPTHEKLWLYDRTSDQLSLLTQRPLHYGPTLSLGPAGQIGFSVGLQGNPALFAHWPFPSSAKRLIVPVVPGFVLPGA